MCMILQLNDLIDCIVSCYAIIAKSNIMILTLNMSRQNAENMRILLHQSRKVFQHLYECIIITSSFNFKHEESSISSRAFTLINLQQNEENNDEDEFSITDDAISIYNENELFKLHEVRRLKYDQLIEIYEVERKKFKKTTIYHKVMTCFNIHAELYFENVAIKYVTLNNCIMFTNKDKHWFFKKMMLCINHRNVKKTLLEKETMWQMIQFILMNFYAVTKSNLTAEMLKIHKKCLILFKWSTFLFKVSH